MACSELGLLMDAFLDGSLAEESEARVERHLLGCARCGHEVRSQQQARALLREAYESPVASPDYRERLAARLEYEFDDVLAALPASPASQLPLPEFRLLDPRYAPHA